MLFKFYSLVFVLLLLEIFAFRLHCEYMTSRLDVSDKKSAKNAFFLERHNFTHLE